MKFPHPRYFKKIRLTMEAAENFEEINVKAGNKAFSNALKQYEDFLQRQEQGDLLRSATYTHTVTDTKLHSLDKNIILFGPPGTGKTYHTVLYSLAMIENVPLHQIQEEVVTMGYLHVVTRYRSYQENGQIQFTTFHQSYGYEEFIEGIKPQLGAEISDQEGSSISYQIKSGIFKQFCEQAQTPIVQEQNEYSIRQEPTIWKVSLGGAREHPIKTDCFKKDRIRIRWDSYGEHLSEQTDYSKHGGANILSRFIEEMMVGDIVLTLHDEKTIDAIGVVTGDYKWLADLHEYKRSRNVRWLATNIREDIYELNGNKVMTLGSVYRLTRITLSDVLHMLKKYNLSSSSSFQENSNNYVFIIDEINRGNISKIFGELITLIEPTKRLERLLYSFPTHKMSLVCLITSIF